MKKIIILLGFCLICSGMLNAENNCNFIGNKKSKKYHINTCRMVTRMNEDNRVCFVSPGEAEVLGYIPCKICKPILRNKINEIKTKDKEIIKHLFANKEK